jgi:hypothetical protein
MTTMAPHYAARLRVAEAFYHGGHDAALQAVAGASLDLASLVASGALLHHIAFDNLQEVAENLGLVRTFGQDAVQEAIATGPRVTVVALKHTRAA